MGKCSLRLLHKSEKNANLFGEREFHGHKVGIMNNQLIDVNYIWFMNECKVFYSSRQDFRRVACHWLFASNKHRENAMKTTIKQSRLERVLSSLLHFVLSFFTIYLLVTCCLLLVRSLAQFSFISRCIQSVFYQFLSLKHFKVCGEVLKRNFTDKKEEKKVNWTLKKKYSR